MSLAPQIVTAGMVSVSAMYQPCIRTYGGFLSHRATPSDHPNFHGVFHEINHPAILVASCL